MASERLSRWGGQVKRFRSCLYSLLVGLQGRWTWLGFENSRAARESVLVEAYEVELVVFWRWEDLHREALGFARSWKSRSC